MQSVALLCALHYCMHVCAQHALVCICVHMLACVHCRVSSCYRHVGECLAQYCKEFEEDAADATPSEAEKKKAESVQSATLDVHQSSKACAAALVNACLASSDENLHNYVVDWIASHGGSETELGSRD